MAFRSGWTEQVFRHVVMFRWRKDSGPEEQAAAVAALQEFALAVADLGSVSVGRDAGLDEANFDAVVVADFPDVASYRAYASDPRHLELIATHIRPCLDHRVAVQAELA